MSSIIIGKLPELESGMDSWDIFRERLHIYIMCNDIPADLHRFVLLSALSKHIYKRLRHELHPQSPKDLTYTEMLETLANMYGPKKEIYERQKLYRSEQNEGESLLNWLKRVESMVNACDFGYYKNEVVRDRFVCGLKSAAIFDHLNKYMDTEMGTTEEAYKIAMQMESVD